MQAACLGCGMRLSAQQRYGPRTQGSRAQGPAELPRASPGPAAGLGWARGPQDLNMGAPPGGRGREAAEPGVWGAGPLGLGCDVGSNPHPHG